MSTLTINLTLDQRRALQVVIFDRLLAESYGGDLSANYVAALTELEQHLDQADEWDEEAEAEDMAITCACYGFGRKTEPAAFSEKLADEFTAWLQDAAARVEAAFA
jgi:hypothetical protein